MYFTHEDFKPENIRYAFFNRKVPVSNHRYFHHHDNYQENKKIIAQIFGSSDIAIVDQKHTNNVIITEDYNSYCIADGQVTNKPNIALAVITADCVPILFADAKAKIISSVHAGWRGARANIIQEAMNKMKEQGASEITAIIGPCIKQKNYEVDTSFYNNFIEESNNYRKFFIPSLNKDHFMFDLPGYVKEKLANSGINIIYDINKNTYEDEENFFSFRRTTHFPESPMGNVVSVIMLEDK